MHGIARSSPSEQEAEAREREEERSRRVLEQETNKQNNRRLLDMVLDNLPTTLTRDDYQMLVFAAIDRLEYEDWEVITERYRMDANESEEPDAMTLELRKRAEEAGESLLVHMLVEFALLRSGYSDEVLEQDDPLASAARRYSSRPQSKRTPKPKAIKCARERTPSNPKRQKVAPITAKSGVKTRTQKERAG